MENANLDRGSKSPQKMKLKDALRVVKARETEDESQPENLINTTVRMSPKLRSAIQAAANINGLEFALEVRNTLESHYGVATSSLRHITVQDLDDAMKAHEQLYHTVKDEQPDQMSGGEVMSVEVTPKARIQKGSQIQTSKILEILIENMEAGRILTPTLLGQDSRINMKGKTIGTRLIEFGIQAKNKRLAKGDKPSRYYLLNMLPQVKDVYERVKKEESSGLEGT